MIVMYSNSEKLILTGHNGYVGKSFLNNQRAQDWLEIELNDLKFDDTLTVVHLASVANKNIYEVDTYISNLKLDMEIIDFIFRHNHRLIYISGNNVYPTMTGANEFDAYGGEDYYSKSKYATECLLKHLPKDKYIILRLADVFGKGQRHGNFFKKLEESILTQSDLCQIGKGLKLRSYIYIKELVLILNHIKGISRYNGEVFNICHEDGIYIFDIINVISSLSGLKVNKIYQEEQCQVDIRTMTQSNISNYQYKYTLINALSDYLKEIVTND